MLAGSLARASKPIGRAAADKFRVRNSPENPNENGALIRANKFAFQSTKNEYGAAKFSDHRLPWIFMK